MRSCYIDTNVLLSQYKPTDPFHQEAVVIIEALKEGEVVGYTSPLTIIEACSFVSRNFPPKRGEKPEDARRIAVSMILKELSRLRFRYISPSGDYSVPLNGQEVRMPATFQLVITLTVTGLRTLDLIHLSAAKYSKQMGAEIGGFITGDREFIRKKKGLSEIIGVPVLSPREYINALGLRK